MGQSGVVNELRLRLNDPLRRRDDRQAGRGADRLQVGVLAGSEFRPAVELRGARFHRADRDGRDAADVVVCHLQHHLHHHQREAPGHRDHEVARHARIPRCGGSSSSKPPSSAWSASCSAGSSATCSATAGRRSRSTITLTGTNVPISIYYSPMHYIVAGGISLLCCTGAAFFPARKATRVHPVEIIRGAS